MNDAYVKLDKRVQNWIFKQGWTNLREIQSLAVEPVLSGATDIVISASTASGKTEAAFLPACSAIINSTEKGVGVLYISPLKALINDQYRRLESLAKMLDMNITPWHGDSSYGKKSKLKQDPSGIVLITPESLEALLSRNPCWVSQAFRPLQYIIIDEFHAFLGTERGQQLISLLTRLEHLLERFESPIPRIALSATLGEIESVPKQLRFNQAFPCKIITETQTSSQIKVQVKGYIQQEALKIPNDVGEKGEVDNAEIRVCKDIYRFCRGGNHLVFANSRQRTESIAAQLSDLCEENIVPNEFFPHHGSLSKELRETLEVRLQNGRLPTTAVCTMTLELGIDIGKVNSVIQVAPPYSISSLTQRLGRSGRRGEASILRMLITESELTSKSNIGDRLRMQLIQSLAMMRLLIQCRWFEPADSNRYHFSTLLHQVLAVLSQWGGGRAEQIFGLLCQKGVFQKTHAKHFKSLLTEMGNHKLITQLQSGEIILGVVGEKVVEHYTFYAVFNTPKEYRVESNGKAIGALPVRSPLLEGQSIIFGGRRWKIAFIDVDKRVISVEPSKGGKPPKFNGGFDMSIHDEVRKEMFKILVEGEYRISVNEQKVDYIDQTAKSLFQESISTFRELELSEKRIIQLGTNVHILPWKGDKIASTIAALLIQNGFEAGVDAGIVSVENVQLLDVYVVLAKIYESVYPTASELAKTVKEKCIEKYDEYLPEDLLALEFGAKAFDMEGAISVIGNMLQARFY